MVSGNPGAVHFTAPSVRVAHLSDRLAVKLLVTAALACAVLALAWGSGSASGHAHMLSVLQSIADDPTDPFFGDAVLKELRAELAALPADSASELEEVMTRFSLGNLELQLGNSQRAVEELKRAYEMLPKLGDRLSPVEKRTIVFSLAIAYMRWGETENCIARHTSRSCIFPIEGTGVHKDPSGSKRAISYLREILTENPDDLSARWILNIAYMTIGGYPEDVPRRQRIDPSLFASAEEFPRFRDIAPRLRLNTFNLSGGAIADDFNNDGLLDLITSTWDTSGQMHYFRNVGDGSYVEETKAAGLTGIVGGLNLVQADYNNDGYTDVLVLRGAWLGTKGRHPNSLLRNNGDGTFTDRSYEAGLARVNYPTQTASWADYDLDGDLDLYIGNEGAPCQLFRNNGDETFTDVAAQAGVQNFGYSKGTIWGDYNDDRYPDLYVSNMGGDNRLYRNNRDGSFTDVAWELGVRQPKNSFAVWFWDFNNDGLLDLYVATYLPKMSELVPDFLEPGSQDEFARLYKGLPGGRFVNVSREQGVGRLTSTMGANFGDLDNDGFLDFYLGTGFPLYSALMPNLMFRNHSGTGFSDITTAGGFGHLQKGHGVVFADFDNDGDQDVFEQIGGAFPGDAFGNVLYENPGFSNHWIKLKLVGVASNRSAIGARIRIDTTEDGKKRTVYRYVNSGGSFGANPLRQEIGLGAAGSIDLLEIFWPKTGLTQRFRDLAVDQALEITEGKARYERIPAGQGAGTSASPEP